MQPKRRNPVIAWRTLGHGALLALFLPLMLPFMGLAFVLTVAALAIRDRLNALAPPTHPTDRIAPSPRGRRM